MEARSDKEVALRAFAPRWGAFRYVYPVIARRSEGLSLGINLTPSQACNFDCVYCQIDRSAAKQEARVDVAVLEDELRQVAGEAARGTLQLDERDPPKPTPLKDFAFSGAGEPTAATEFPQAARLVAAVRAELGLVRTKIVVITNACFLTRPAVAETLGFLDGHNLDLWAKLDAGTQEYFGRINRAGCTLAHITGQIALTARRRPVTIQSLFLKLDGEGPSDSEIDAYIERLQDILEPGGRIRLVQLYTVARKPAEASVTPLEASRLNEIAARVKELGVMAKVFQ